MAVHTEAASLPDLFQRAWDVHDHIDSADDAQLQEAIRWLQLGSQMVASLGLFSTNEQADDVATADLKYLLVPYLLGEAQSRNSIRDRTARMQHLEDAAASLTRFMEQAQQYGLLGEAEAVLLAGTGQDGQELGRQLDPATKRAHKIARFRMEKDAHARLEAVRLQGLRQRRLRELEGDEDTTAGDEGEEREAWLLQIQLAGARAADTLDVLRQELELLRHAASLPKQAMQQPPEPPAADVMAALQRAATALGSTGGAAERERLRAGVFRPSHELPTMSLAQQAEREMAAAQAASEAQAAAEARRKKQAAEDMHGEAETMRQRAWDDWKDDNPAGSGNSKLRPTA